MTEPVQRIEVQVPAEQVRVGDLLADHGDGEVRQVIPDAVPEYVYAFAPEQVPLVRATLIRVRRDVTLVPGQYDPDPKRPATAAEVGDIRDLVLALVDLQPASGKAVAPVQEAAARVRKARKP